MSFWTLDSFDNKSAKELVTEVLQASDLSLLEEVLMLVLESKDSYLERGEAERGLAALEILAAVRARPCTSFAEQDDLVEWLELNQPSEDPRLIQLGLKALARIIAPDSELQEYWEDQATLNSWLAEMDDLRERLED